MKRNILRLGAAVALAVTLAGCGADAGVIQSKDHSPGHTTIISVCVPNTNGGCTPQVQPQYIPATWSIVVLEDDGDLASQTVRKSTWTQLNVGDRWTPSH